MTTDDIPPRMDLRTQRGRGRKERRALHALRFAYIEDHPEMTVEVIATEFYARGWYSEKTVWVDALRMVDRMRHKLAQEHA